MPAAATFDLESEMIGIAVVGYGYWGPNLVRNFCETSGRAAGRGLRSETRSAWRRCRAAIRRSRITDDFDEILSDPAIDAVAIATPVSTPLRPGHARADGRQARVRREADGGDGGSRRKRLVDEAARRSLVLAVDHTFVYTGAVRKMRELVEHASSATSTTTTRSA